jgi:hypothetical protein
MMELESREAPTSLLSSAAFLPHLTLLDPPEEAPRTTTQHRLLDRLENEASDARNLDASAPLHAGPSRPAVADTGRLHAAEDHDGRPTATGADSEHAEQLPRPFVESIFAANFDPLADGALHDPFDPDATAHHHRPDLDFDGGGGGAALQGGGHTAATGGSEPWGHGTSSSGSASSQGSDTSAATNAGTQAGRSSNGPAAPSPPPVANNDSYSILHDHTLTVAAAGVLSNDTNMSGQPLSAVRVSNAAHGNVTLNSNGGFTYVPSAGYTGQDSFTYYCTAAGLNSNTATVTLTVFDQAPTAVNDQYQVAHNHTLSVATANGVLANDSDGDHDVLTAQLYTGHGPSHGSLTLNADGSLSYAPTTGYVGSDSFQYRAFDGALYSAPATVTIQVTNTAPVANGDHYSLNHDTTLEVTAATGVLANDTDADSDALRAFLATNPAHGSLTLGLDGSVTYTPATHFVGSDSFTYWANDTHVNSATAAMVYLNVANTTPVASNDAYSIPHDQTLVVAASGVLANDTDAEHDPLTASLVAGTGPQHGTLTLNADGSFRYVPQAHWAGTDGFQYVANDGIANSNAAYAQLTVTNSPPTAVNDSYGVTPNSSMNVSAANGVLANDSNPDGDPLTVTLVMGVQHGSLTLHTDGSFSYTPSANYTGTDSFVYQETDGISTSSASVTIYVGGLTATGSTINAVEGQGFTGVVATFTDSNPNTTAGSYTATITWGDGGTSAGTVQANGQGGFVVVGSHTYAEEGSYSISVAISDVGSVRGTATGTATVADAALSWVTGPTFTWTPVNQPPPVLTNPGAQTSAEGASVSLQVSATDPNGASLNYDALDLPVGLSIDPSTGVISGTVDYSAAEDFGGSYQPILIVVDSLGNSASQTFVWTITDTDRPPLLTNPGNQSNGRGDSVALQLQASDPDSDQVLYDATGLPSGLNIDSLSGLIRGTIDPSAVYGTPYTVTITASDSILSASQTITWAITATNHAPVATSPGAQANVVGDSVSVPITAGDADGNTLSYTASGLPAGLGIDPGSGIISGTVAASAASNTAYNVAVLVSDGSLSTTQTFTWSVNSVSLAAPGDQSSVNGDVVSLQLSGSSPNGSTLTYGASGLPAGLSIDTSTGLISGTLANSADAASPYSVTAMVTDGSHSASQTFTWTVAHLRLSNPGDQSGQEGGTVSLQLAGSDVDGDALSYSAVGLPSGLSINSSGLISGMIAANSGPNSPYETTVTAGDGPHSASQSFLWTVTPRVTVVPPADQTNAAGDAVSLAVAATDSAGQSLTYSASGLPAGLSINAASGVISGTIALTAASTTPYSVSVTATDGAYSSTQSFAWTVSHVLVISPGDQSSPAGNTVTLAISARDHDGYMLTYSATGLPPGLSINSSTGVITGTVAAGADANSPYGVLVTASDGSNSANQVFVWTVAPRVALTNPGDQENAAATAVTLALSAQAPSGDTLTYTASGLPPGLAINAATGLISGTIAGTADADSPYAVTLTASDGTYSSTQTLNWTIDPHVTITPPGDQSSAAGAVVTLAISASDADSDTLSYIATGLPAGLAINSGTGVITGTIAAGADSSSPYTVTVSASDGAQSGSQTFSWTVTHLALTNPGDQSSADGAVVSLAIQVGNASGGALSYSAAGLPTGLSINSSTGVITGTIALAAHTSSPFLTTVTLSDGTHTANQTFLWNVSHIGMTQPVDRTNLEGDTVSLQVAAQDADGDGLIYSAGGLPAGLSISPTTGMITGTVAPGAAAGGPYTITVAATDGAFSSSQAFTWTVNPRVTLTAPPDQTNLEGDSVSLQLQATDTSGAALTYSADSLPPGLSLNAGTGLISGSIAAGASSGGPYVATISASDGTYSASQTLNWTVMHPNNQAPAVTNPGAQTNSEADSVNLPIVASDPNNDSLIYSATGLPSGLSVDPFQGIISGTIASDAASASPYNVTVSVDDGNGGVSSQRFLWSIQPASLSGQGVPFSATEGIGTAPVVATFTSADLSLQGTDSTAQQIGDFSANISWGDGTSDAGMVAGSAGTFTVTGIHSYDHPGRFAVTVAITDTEGSHASVVSTATVAPAGLSASGGMVLAALTGVSTSLTLAEFTDANPNDQAGSYATSIDWGDGSATSSATVQGDDGIFTVSGSHKYLSHGTFAVHLTMTDGDGTSTAATSIVTASDVYVGIKANLTVGTFTDANPNATAADYTATIYWGDGTHSTGTVSGSKGAFTVTGSHIYANEGTYTIQSTIADDGGSALSATSTVIAGSPPVELLGATLPATPTVPLTNEEVAAFADPDVSDSASSFSAAINWGDNTPNSFGTITGASGLFIVTGSHTYTSSGEFAINVQLFSGDGNLDGAVVAKADAAPAAPPATKGPTVVPGYTKYSYLLSFAAINKADVAIGTWSFGHSKAAKVESQTLVPSSSDAGKVIGINIVAFFYNEPVEVKLQVANFMYAGKSLAVASFPIDIVQVKIKTGATNNVSYVGKAGQLAAPRNNRISADPATIRARYADLTVESISGPKATDVDYIDMGFIQNIAVTANHADYNQFTPKLRRVSSLEGNKYLDVFSQPPFGGMPGLSSTPPWLDTVGLTVDQSTKKIAYFFGKDNNARSNIAFNTIDSPQVPAADMMKLTEGGVTKGVDYFALVLDFNLYFAVHTTEAVNGSQNVFTQLAQMAWQFDGSGNVGAGGVWTQAAKQASTGAKSFAMVTTGAVVPITTTPIFNSELQKETWNTIKQK